MPLSALKKLDEQVGAVLNGTASPESLPAGLQASLSRAVYLKAKDVLANGSNKAMKQALDALPATVRPLVAKECRRITNWRNNNAN